MEVMVGLRYLKGLIHSNVPLVDAHGVVHGLLTLP